MAFKTTLFSKASETPVAPNDGAYPPEAWEFQLPNDHQIPRAFKRMKPYKATRNDSLPNILFIQCADLISPRFGPRLRATFTLEYYPDNWSRNEL